ncbi:hypothetical protein StrepF001_43825 [Streptomyces sp. F001]|nr:hypothetical protein StrepF001_43825 [Streptomyces sp. F001]
MRGARTPPAAPRPRVRSHSGTTPVHAAVLQPSKPTSLLAALLIHSGAVVSTDYLMRAVWDTEPPATARAALQSCVLRLRRIFAKYGIANDTIEAVPGGYRMRMDRETLDLVRFRGLVRSADSARDAETESHVLREALALWHGPVLANVSSQMLHRDEAPRLTEERLRALERLCDIELARGRCREVLVEVWDAARRFPERERFSEQLIEALYRTGRQTEALAEIRGVKERLKEEFGIDPGAPLQRLELAILRGEDLGSPPARGLPAIEAGVSSKAALPSRAVTPSPAPSDALVPVPAAATVPSSAPPGARPGSTADAGSTGHDRHRGAGALLHRPHDSTRLASTRVDFRWCGIRSGGDLRGPRDRQDRSRPAGGAPDSGGLSRRLLHTRHDPAGRQPARRRRGPCPTSARERSRTPPPHPRRRGERRADTATAALRGRGRRRGDEQTRSRRPDRHPRRRRAPPRHTHRGGIASTPGHHIGRRAGRRGAGSHP